MEMKLFDSELRIMNILWEKGDTTAKGLAEILAEQIGWSKTTTYTVIKKCIDKGAASRIEPNFLCHALVTRQQTQERETDELIDKMFGGRPEQLIASILWRKDLSPEVRESLKNLVNDLPEGN
ncbi:MAG: BlaI/MecI/CopY family transcriptional regulator [Clostridiales bacterium]|nr:BlaI/MecI/CopY family transcriptional regulator [Clostridiales bacterium]